METRNAECGTRNEDGTGRTLREEYEAPTGLHELRRRHGMSFRAIRAALRQQGTVLRKRGHIAGTPWANHPNRKLAQARVPELLALCDEGRLTLEQIGAQFGITKQRVSQIARQHGRTRL